MNILYMHVCVHTSNIHLYVHIFMYIIRNKIHVCMTCFHHNVNFELYVFTRCMLAKQIVLLTVGDLTLHADL